MLFGSTTSRVDPNKNKSYEVPQCPTDTINRVAWFPSTNSAETLLASASWDNFLKVWNVKFNSVTNTIEAVPRVQYNFENPVLCCAFSRQGAVFGGDSQGNVKMCQIEGNQTQVIAKHSEGVCDLFFDDTKNCLITGSFDRKVCFWDCRQQQPIHTIQLQAKVFAMDYRDPILLIAGSDLAVYASSMASIKDNPVKIDVQLKTQLRSICISPNKDVYGLTSIEGRSAINMINQSLKSQNFAFKCHRVDEKGPPAHTNVFAVHCNDFHPIATSAYVTAGGDGGIVFWDVSKRCRIKAMECMKVPVTALRCDPSGKMMAYAIGYDWSKGVKFNDKDKYPTKLYIHALTEDLLSSKDVRR